MTTQEYRPPGTRFLRTDVRYMTRRDLFASSVEFLIAGVICAVLYVVLTVVSTRWQPVWSFPDWVVLGALFMFLELATAYAGRLYGVNAFDQPGVELGKQFTYAMLGRADADAARREWDLLPKPDPKRIV